jgi:hypothetical protein
MATSVIAGVEGAVNLWRCGLAAALALSVSFAPPQPAQAAETTPPETPHTDLAPPSPPRLPVPRHEWRVDELGTRRDAPDPRVARQLQPCVGTDLVQAL